MNKNLVKYEVDLSNPPPLTNQQKTELAALAHRQEIDDSGIPPLSNDALKNAFPRRHYKPARTTAAA